MVYSELRMIMAIAAIYGFDIHSDKVKDICIYLFSRTSTYKYSKKM